MIGYFLISTDFSWNYFMCVIFLIFASKSIQYSSHHFAFTLFLCYYLYSVVLYFWLDQKISSITQFFLGRPILHLAVTDLSVAVLTNLFSAIWFIPYFFRCSTHSFIFSALHGCLMRSLRSLSSSIFSCNPVEYFYLHCFYELDCGWYAVWCFLLCASHNWLGCSFANACFCAVTLCHIFSAIDILLPYLLQLLATELFPPCFRSKLCLFENILIVIIIVLFLCLSPIYLSVAMHCFFRLIY